MERRLAYPTNPSPVENQYIPEMEENDMISFIYIIPNIGKNATSTVKLCIEDISEGCFIKNPASGRCG